MISASGVSAGSTVQAVAGMPLPRSPQSKRPRIGGFFGNAPPIQNGTHGEELYQRRAGPV